MPSRTLLAALVCDREIDLLLERVHPRNEDADVIADFVSAVCAAANQPPLNRIETIEVVLQSRNVHYAGHERVRQLYNETVISNIHDRRPEDLRISILELLLKKLELLESHRLDLGIGSVSLRA